jgi:hypothetical protein
VEHAGADCFPRCVELLQLDIVHPTQQPGTCAAAPLGNVIQTNLVVNLTGSTAWDRKEDALDHRWHLNVDGMFVVTEPAASHPYCYAIGDNLLSHAAK